MYSNDRQSTGHSLRVCSRRLRELAGTPEQNKKNILRQTQRRDENTRRRRGPRQFIHISNTVCYFGLVVKADYHVWHGWCVRACVYWLLCTVHHPLRDFIPYNPSLSLEYIYIYTSWFTAVWFMRSLRLFLSSSVSCLVLVACRGSDLNRNQNWLSKRMQKHRN